MTRARLALLIASPVLLAALAACGDERGGKGDRREAPAPAFGFELAMAGADAGNAAAAAAEPMIDLTPEQLAARLATGHVRLIDLRTDAEVAQGIIPGAEHIPLDQFDPAKLDLSDDRAVVLYCRSGRRSQIAGEKLAAALGQPVEHLAGGILAWEDAGQPIEQR